MREIKDHANKVHNSRHARLGMQSTSKHPGYQRAEGGAAHSDARQDKAMIRKMVKPDALDLKRGGKAKKGATHVNIMIGQPSGAGPAGAGVPPQTPPRPPMPLPPAGAMAGPSPGIGGVAGPMPRKRGGGVRQR